MTDRIEGVPEGYRLGSAMTGLIDGRLHIAHELIPIEQPKPYCPDCNSVRMSHCSAPEHCGNVVYPEQPKQPTYAEYESEMMDRMMEVEDERHKTEQPKQLEADDSILTKHRFNPVGGEFPETCRDCACFRSSANHIQEPKQLEAVCPCGCHDYGAPWCDECYAPNHTCKHPDCPVCATHPDRVTIRDKGW